MTLEAGYPLPGKVLQTTFTLPKGAKLESLRMYAEIEKKGLRHKIKWAIKKQKKMKHL